MLKKCFIVIVLYLLPTIINAQVISEIMYNPSGTDSKREWIEIYNDTNSALDLTLLKLVENDVNHSISEFSGGYFRSW